MFVDGPGDCDSSVYLPDRMGSERTGRASDVAPVVELPDPADYYHHLFPQDT